MCSWNVRKGEDAGVRISSLLPQCFDLFFSAQLSLDGQASFTVYNMAKFTGFQTESCWNDGFFV